MVNYMNSKGHKLITASKILKSPSQEKADENMRDQYTFKKLGRKTLMRNCRGFQADNKDGVYTF